MALTIPVQGGVIQASDVSQVVYVLQRQSGQTETGKYWLGGSTYATGAVQSGYMPSLNRNTVPVSVSTDTSDQALTGFTALNAQHLSANGFQFWGAGTGVNTNCNVAGNWTIQF